MNQSNNITIYTDGSCSPNPGTGGWAAILIFPDGTVEEISGKETNTTNNRVEIMSMVKALEYIKEPSDIILYTDSQHTINSIGWWQGGEPVPGHKGWIINWQHNFWKTAGKTSVKNVDLLKQMYLQVQRHKSLQFSWVRGHNGDKYNERCDVLANEARTSPNPQQKLRF